MRSSTGRVGIPNNARVGIGPASLGVMWAQPGPPPTVRIAVMAGTPGVIDANYTLSPGGEFPIGAETWRFTEVIFGPTEGRFQVVVERLDENTGAAAELQPYGQLTEDQLRTLETALGRTLPPRYRAWLAATNGARPTGRHAVPGVLFDLYPERPLLGVHPQYPPFDLESVDAQQRRPWLPDDVLVIAVPPGGLLVVRLSGPTADEVVFFPEDAKRGWMDPAVAAVQAQHLMPVAADIDEFVQRRLRLYERY